MTVPTPLATRPIAHTPLVTRYTAPTHVSLPHVIPHSGQANGTSPSSSTPLPSLSTDAPSNFHVVSHVVHPHYASRSERANGSFASSSTPSISHSTAHISSTHPLVARPIVPTHVSPPHVASHPEQTNGTSTSSSTPPLSHPTATSSRFHGALHEPHPPIAPCSVRSRASSTLSSTLHTLPSHLDDSPSTLAPHKKRSRRCFVCGGMGKHRLNPRFCPRTYELLSKRLVKFDANSRLVSDDGSPLPMTRHPGGVAAHLLLPRRLSPRTVHVTPRSVSKSPGTSQSNPPHVPHAPRDPPVPVPHRVPDAVPIADENPPHALPAVVEHPRRISAPDRRFEANPPHFPRVERPSSPPFRILTPIRESLPRPETPSKSRRYPDNAFILLLLDCLVLSPSWRRELAGLIDAINRLNLDDDIPRLQKLMEPVRERYKTFVPSI